MNRNSVSIIDGSPAMEPLNKINLSHGFGCDDDEEFEDASENLSNDSGLSIHGSGFAGNNSVSSSDDDLEHVGGENRTDKPVSLPVSDNCPTLEQSLEEISGLLEMTLNNRFHEAFEGTERWSHCSLYHALGKGTLSFLKGCLTLERPEIQKALEALHNCMDVCQKEKRQSLTRYVWTPNYNTYSDVEVHAELCHAEALLMTALLTFLEDQNFMNFVRGAFRIRSCYQLYKECFYILNNRTEWSSEYSQLHFESGVRMGIGTFNLMISHMPSKVLKLLEFVGFSGNRTQGLKELEASAFLEHGLRRPLAVLIMLAYQCYIEHIFGLGDGDMQCVEKMLEYALDKHPDGAFFLLFKGRKLQLTGQVNEAIQAFKRCISVQNEWKQFHNICHWELLWCHAIKCDWKNAADCADILRKECKWSPGAYTYQYATFLYMIMEEENKPELRSKISELLKQVPDLRVRFAGKTIPAEKFAIVQSKRYFDNNETLVLPVIEYMYIWNIFAGIGQSPDLLNPILERIEKALAKLNLNWEDENSAIIDDYCRCLLLKGMCLRYLLKNEESNQCFMEVIENKKRIKRDTYLIPSATLELALNYMKLEQYVDARKWLENAKEYSGYTLETIIHFRIHTSIRTMNMQQKKTKTIEIQDLSGKKNHNGGIQTIWNALSKSLSLGNDETFQDD